MVRDHLQATPELYAQVLWAYEKGDSWPGRPWNMYNDAFLEFGTELEPVVQYFLTGHEGFLTSKPGIPYSTLCFQQFYWLCRALPPEILTDMAPHPDLMITLQPNHYTMTPLATELGYYLFDTILHQPDAPTVERCKDAGRDEMTFEIIMWSFLQCLNVPRIKLDPTVHTLADWIKLTGPLIGSIVAQCPGQRSFVIVSMDDEKRGHSSVFMVDIPNRRQTFFDPSQEGRSFYSNMFTFFKTNQLWGQPHWTCEVVNTDGIGDASTMQCYFEPMDGSKGGSCTSVCLLFIACCLRFNCWDLQKMCDAMRLIVQFFYNQDPEGSRKKFVNGLYMWHRSMDPLPQRPTRGNIPIPVMDGWRKRSELLLDVFAVRLRAPPHVDRICGVLLDSGDLCRAPLCAGWAVCTDHLLTHYKLVCGHPFDAWDNRWNEPVRRIKPELPKTLLGRMDATRDCPVIGTVIYHVHPQQMPQSTIGVLENGPSQFTILRLVSFVHKNADGSVNLDDLSNHLQLVPWSNIRAQNPRLLLQLFVPLEADCVEMGKVVQRAVPMSGWEALLVLSDTVGRVLDTWLEEVDEEGNTVIKPRRADTWKSDALAISVDTTRRRNSSVVTGLLEATKKYANRDYCAMHIFADALPRELVVHFPNDDSHGALRLVMHCTNSEIIRQVQRLLWNAYWGYMRENGMLLRGIHVLLMPVTHWVSMPNPNAYVSGEQAVLQRYFPNRGTPNPLPIHPLV